ncbi:MAG TPA: hypothetical protein VF808_06855 [Ktedonobacterales bacterium]
MQSVVWSARSVRLFIGFLGLTVPLALWLGRYVFEGKGLEDSISAYYYSPSVRPLFVALIVALGVMLVYYQYKTADNLVSLAAGLAAVGVALFPTLPDPPFDPWQNSVSLAHYIFAAVFFISLAVIVLCLFTRTKSTKTPLAVPFEQTRTSLANASGRLKWARVEGALRPPAGRYPQGPASAGSAAATGGANTMTKNKQRRNLIYDLCGAVIVLCLVLIALRGLFHIAVPLPFHHEAFWLESIALWAFGAAWIVKGELIPGLKG